MNMDELDMKYCLFLADFLDFSPFIKNLEKQAAWFLIKEKRFSRLAGRSFV